MGAVDPSIEEQRLMNAARRGGTDPPPFASSTASFVAFHIDNCEPCRHPPGHSQTSPPCGILSRWVRPFFFLSARRLPRNSPCSFSPGSSRFQRTSCMFFRRITLYLGAARRAFQNSRRLVCALPKRAPPFPVVFFFLFSSQSAALFSLRQSLACTFRASFSLPSAETFGGAFRSPPSPHTSHAPLRSLSIGAARFPAGAAVAPFRTVTISSDATTLSSSARATAGPSRHAFPRGRPKAPGSPARDPTRVPGKSPAPASPARAHPSGFAGVIPATKISACRLYECNNAPRVAFQSKRPPWATPASARILMGMGRQPQRGVSRVRRRPWSRSGPSRDIFSFFYRLQAK